MARITLAFSAGEGVSVELTDEEKSSYVVMTIDD